MPSSDPDVPYISIVAVARNGGKDDNLRAFVESWTHRAAVLRPSAELIVVACGALDVAASAVRVIEVPGDTPEMTARNAGIRRARGEFILSTAIDIVFSEELMQFLASRQLQKGRLYRIDRYDLPESGPSNAPRRIHAREGTFDLTAEGLRENQAGDIAGAQSGIHFGAGWFPAEQDSDTGEVFRWMENAAEVVLPGSGSARALTMEFEPGPGLGPLPQVVKVLDTAGAIVAEWAVSGRMSVQLWVPPTPLGTRHTLRISVPDGGRPLVDDLRILNFRFFRCDWVPPKPPPAPCTLLSLRTTLTRLIASYARSHGAGSLLTNAPAAFRAALRLLRGRRDDIFGKGIEYCSRGWHRLEGAGTEQFRWVSTDAELVVRIEGGQQDVCFLAEPGPSLKGQPFHLVVRLAGGQEIGRVLVNGLTLLRIPVPFAAGPIATLFLSPDEPGDAIPGDSRILNFRVLACACEASEHPLESGKLTGPRNWTSVTVSESAVGIDWPSRLQAHRREIMEIGKPAFLHVNACDFLLMDRERWFEVRGFPEANDVPDHSKALFCYNAHYAGAGEEVLREPLRIHRLPGPEAAATILDDDRVWLITQMRRFRVPAILNPEGWGLAGSALREAGTLAPVYAARSEE